MTPADAIGDYLPTDWRLDPAEHAGRLAPEAAPLQRVLDGARSGVIITQYDESDGQAGRDQAEYKRVGRAEIYLASAAALLGGIALYLGSGGSSPEAGDAASAITVPEWLIVVFVVVQVACLAGAVAAKFLLRQGNAYVKWQQSRTRAENVRLELFETVCGLTTEDAPPPVREGELPLLPLQLEYFLRYQLAVQVNFYRDRGRQHAKGARQLVGWGALITFVAVFFSSLAATGLRIGTLVGAVSIVGLAAPVLLAAQTNLSRLSQDERNAARYRTMYLLLQNAQKEQDLMREAAIKGDAVTVRSYMRRTNDLISVEHREWIALQVDSMEASTAPAEDAQSTRRS